MRKIQESKMKIEEILCDPFALPIGEITQDYVYLKPASLVEELVLKYTEYDDNYDLTYFTSSINNATLSYYGERDLSDEDMLKLEFVLMKTAVFNHFKAFIKLRNLPYDESSFRYYVSLFARNYRIKIEPADFLGVL